MYKRACVHVYRQRDNRNPSNIAAGPQKNNGARSYISFLKPKTTSYLSQFYNCCWLVTFTDILLDLQHIMEHWSGERSIGCVIRSERVKILYIEYCWKQ